jgi:hypothetical protein
LHEYDRTTGRIVDQPTHELNQIESPPATDLEQIEQDRERQQRIDRQRATEEPQDRSPGPPPASPVPMPPPIPGAVVSMDEDKQGLEAEVLEAIVAYERGTRQAGAELAEDPAALQARRRQLGSQLEHRLDRILAHYDVRRQTLPPATRPAP